MADRSNPFAYAHYQKTALSQQTAKRIQLIYKQSARDIEKQLRNLRMLTPSDSLKKVYLENLLKDVTKSSDSFNRLVQNTIMNAGEQSGSIAVEAGNRFMKNAGLEIKGAYSYIPRQQIENIASGKLYGDKWSLSKSIWKNGTRTKSDMEKIVAKGLAENRPIKAIADDLTKYVDPTARKPWDWSKVYPGTAAQVDYNAQRLARTMIQHSFQTSLVQSQLYNPFCKGIIWYSEGIHGRTCQLCMERDGKVFPLKDLPLDHPNGLCYFEPALDEMDNIADRLANWANGGADPDIESYILHGLNLPAKSFGARVATSSVRESTAKNRYIQKRLKGGTLSKLDVSKTAKQEFINKNLTHMQKKVLNFGSQKGRAAKNWEAVNERLLQLNGQQLRLLQKTEHRYYFTSQGSEMFFDEAAGRLVIPLNTVVKNGDWDAFFHELGHVIDYGSYKYVSKGIKYAYRTERDHLYADKLYSYLEADFKKLMRGNSYLPADVRKDLLRDSYKSSGVQDIISGMTGDKVRITYGHDAAYWGKVGSSRHKAAVNAEAVANMFAAWTDPAAEKFMKKYFPKAYKYWKREAIKSL